MFLLFYEQQQKLSLVRKFIFENQQFIKITSNLFTSNFKCPPHWQLPTRPVHLNTLKASQIQQMPPNYYTHPVFVPNFSYLTYVKHLAPSSLSIYSVLSSPTLSKLLWVLSIPKVLFIYNIKEIMP